MEMYEGNRGKKWEGRIMRGERGRERGDEDGLKLSDIVGSYRKVWGKHGEEVRRMRGREGKREGGRGQPEAI